MNLPLDQLDLLGTPADLLAGAPMQLAIDSIIEDPEQPRNEFDPEGLAELAASIKERGVLQPISVRRHPDQPDCWMLNFGARRLRASKLVGKFDIPAFVDKTADSYVLRRWSVDASPDHSLDPASHHLWLRNTPTLYGVESASLAPGSSGVATERNAA